MQPATSVLIRAKNEAKDISQALQLVSEQLLSCEIIVVDSGSTDGTVEIVKQWPNVKLIQIRPEEFTFGRSLNIGFEAAEGEIVVPLSAHAFPCSQHWLQNLVKHFDDPQVAKVYGRQVPHADAWPPVQRDFLAFWDDQPRIQTSPDSRVEHRFSNSNAAIRRKYWEKRCFDETLSGCEDQEWARAMLRLGLKIVYEPDAGVYHSHNEPLLKVYVRTYRETLARQSFYGSNTNIGLRRALQMWLDSVSADVRFILKNQKDHEWLLRTLIYRVFWTYGYLKPSLPAALWEPFIKRWKQITKVCG